MGNNVLALQRFVLFNSDSRLRWRQRLSLSLSLSLSPSLSPVSPECSPRSIVVKVNVPLRDNIHT